MTTRYLDPRIERVFDELLETPVERRAERLHELCGDDERLRLRVERLLVAEQEVPVAFLEGGAPVGAVAPTRIGEFTIVERLGEGGMGTVYAARQRSPERDVAIKVIRAEHLSDEAVRRFRFEIELLGQLQHPGIARIYQSGTLRRTGLGGEAIDVPYFVMELVRGEPLLEYVRRRALSIEHRLDLFVQVCEAVDHAHQRGVIHRDLKSDNVLVAEYETGAPKRGDGTARRQPKILDFGIARPVSAAGATGIVTGVAPAPTRTGDLVGTLPNMSPEQVSGGAQAIDARADVYALGVILFELLGGRPPIDVARVPLDEAVRRVREETPPALGTLDAALAGDLETIAAKALEKDAERRYRSAWDLAEDVRRYLKGEPIEARADSTWYVLRREFARHRSTALSVAIVFGLVLAFALVALRQASSNRVLADRAQNALRRSNVERGRLMGAAGNPAGEGLLWRSFFEAPDDDVAVWALVEYYAQHPSSAARRTNAGEIRNLAVSPRDGHLLVPGADGRVRILDGATLEELDVWTVSESALHGIAFPPDGRTVSFGTADGFVRTWSFDERREVAAWGEPGEWMSSLDYSPDGTLAATTCRDGRVSLWDPGRGTIERELARFDGPAWRAVFSPDGRELLAVGEGGARLWRAPFDRPPQVLANQRGEVVGAAYAPNGRLAWTGGTEQTLDTWNRSDGTHSALALENGTVRRIVPSASGRLVHIVGWWRIETYDVASGERVASIPLAGFTWGLASSSDGRALFVGDNEGLVRRWETGRPGFAFFPSDAPRVDVALTPDGASLWMEDDPGELISIDVASGEPAPIAVPSGTTVHGVWHAPHGETTAVAFTSRTLVMRSDTLEPLFELPAPKTFTSQTVAFSPDGAHLAYASASGDLLLYALGADAPRERVIEREARDPIAVAFSPDGRLLAVIDRKRTEISIVDVATGRELRTLTHPGDRPWSVDWTRDGRTVVAGTWERVLQVWDTDTGALLHRLQGHRGAVWDVRFLTGTDVAVSCSDDGTVRLWDPVEGTPLASFDLRGTLVPRSLDVISGDRVAIGGEGRGAVLLDLRLYFAYVLGNLDYAVEAFAPDGADVDRDALRASIAAARAPR